MDGKPKSRSFNIYRARGIPSETRCWQCRQKDSSAAFLNRRRLRQRGPNGGRCAVSAGRLVGALCESGRRPVKASVTSARFHGRASCHFWPAAQKLPCTHRRSFPPGQDAMETNKKKIIFQKSSATKSLSSVSLWIRKREFMAYLVDIKVFNDGIKASVEIVQEIHYLEGMRRCRSL